MHDATNLFVQFIVIQSISSMTIVTLANSLTNPESSTAKAAATQAARASQYKAIVKTLVNKDVIS